MRLAALCLVLTLMPGPASAQDTAAGRVAELARHALAAPNASTAWSALANAIPELALAGGGGLEETFEAARIADSLALAAGGPVIRVTPEGLASPGTGLSLRVASPRDSVSRASGPAFAGLERQRPEDVFPTGPALLVIVGAGVVTLTLMRVRARRSPARSAAPVAAARRGRTWTVRDMGRGDADLAEVARRTGMTREAVALALRLEGTHGRRAV